MSTSSSFSFPPDLAQFVQQEVSAGKYQNAEEIVCQGLRLLQDREQRLEALRRAVLPAVARLDRGEGRDFEDEADLQAFLEGMMDDVDRRLDAQRGGK